MSANKKTRPFVEPKQTPRMPRMVVESRKGRRGGICHQSNCEGSPAVYLHADNNVYACKECAEKTNRIFPSTYIRLAELEIR